MVDPSDPRLQGPRSGCILLGIPPIAVVVTGLAYAGMFYLGIGGRPADGEVVTMQVQTCAEARPVLEERLRRMGLNEHTFEETEGGWAITAQLPSDPEAAAAIPETLQVPGHLQIRDLEGEVLYGNEAVADGTVRMDLLLRPKTLLVLTGEAAWALGDRFKADPEGSLALWMDGEQIGTWHHTKGMDGTLEVEPSAENDRQRMHLAARRGVVLGSGPLPCEVRIVPDAESL